MAEDRISRAASAAEQLSSVLWEAVHEEMRAGRTLEVVALTDRIAEVCRSVSAVANAGGSSLGVAAREASGAADRAASGEAATGGVERRERGSGPASDGPRNGSEPALGRDPLAGLSSMDSPPSAEDLRRDRGEDAPEVDGPPERGGRPAALVDEHEGAATPIAIRDARGAERSAWAEAIVRRLDRYADDGVPFAVLLIEVIDAERLRIAEGEAETRRMIREVEGSIVEQLRPADALLREADGRYWLIAPQTEAAVAGSLVRRIAVAARRAASHRGAPLEVSIGIALCPDHGVEVSTLIAHADIDLYAAQAEGRRFKDDDERPPI